MVGARSSAYAKPQLSWHRYGSPQRGSDVFVVFSPSLNHGDSILGALFRLVVDDCSGYEAGVAGVSHCASPTRKEKMPAHRDDAPAVDTVLD